MRSLSIVIIMLSACIFGSCSKSEPFDNVVMAEATGMFNYVTSVSRASGGMVSEDVGYLIVFDDESRLCNITISNLRLSSGGEPHIYTFTDVPWDFDQNRPEVTRVIDLEALTGRDGAGEVTLTDVMMMFVQSNGMSRYGGDGLVAEYVVNGMYKVTAYPYETIGQGTTRVDHEGDESVDYEVAYYVQLDPRAMTADVEVGGLDLDGVKHDFAVSGLKLTLTLTPAGYELSADAATVILGLTGVSLDDFLATADLTDELKVDMTLRASDGRVWRVAAFLVHNFTR